VVGSTAQNWRDLLSVTEPINRLAPFMPIPGNHDNTSAQAVPAVYKDSLALPGNEEYFSFDYGNVHFIGVHTGRANDVADSAILFRPGTPQHDWLASDLAQAASDPAITWTVVYHHYPAYAYGVSQALKARQYLSPLMDQYGVDLVLNGHRHVYERMKSIRAEAVVQNGPSYTDNPPGTVYQIVGPAGGNLQGGGSTSYTAFSSARQAFGVMSVNGSQLTYQAVDDTGAVFDTWTLTKGAATPGPTPTPTPTPAPSSNLVPNPGFETGTTIDATRWTEGTSHARASDRPHGGAWSLKSTFTGTGTSTRSVAIAVVPNTTYTYSAWIYKGSTTGAAYVDMSDIAGEAQLAATQTNTWQLVSATWNSGSRTSVTLRCVTDGTPNGPSWFDQISLTSP
jgi:calcineurin-like phosphoesterase family protein